MQAGEVTDNDNETNPTPDGCLALVSSDLTLAADVSHLAPAMRCVIDLWRDGEQL
ncbi:hypothetical protein [Microbulbifer rhizosphaerae]|uniref:hypothetical protein n=1 Tax=Microbulbifer rhizosphaerae TaxID=1562603 RepID=UPI003CCCFE39